MRQILVTIPLHDWFGELHPWLDFLPNLPIYVYGMMLFFAFIFCGALARRMCRREGIDENHILDLEIWLFVAGILGSRVVFVIQYWDRFAALPSLTDKLKKIVSLWDGGLVLYGGLFGGVIGYYAYYHFHMRQHKVSHWKMIDVVAPCLALGVVLGRIGCLCTGCCYGNVACSNCPQIHFPLYSAPMQLCAPTQDMIRRGYQTPFGFLLKEDSLEVIEVEPDLAAAEAGLQVGDRITAVNGVPARRADDIWSTTDAVQLSVVRKNGTHLELPAFVPNSIGLNPTQIYETISMSLLMFFLLSYYPYKRRDGELMVLFMFCYGMHRFLNEWLRTDTEKVAFNLTLSQNVSLAVFVGGAILAYFVWRQPLITDTPQC